MGDALLAVPHLGRSAGQIDPSQVFVEGLVAVGLADEQKMPAAIQNRLAERLIGVEVIAQIDRLEPLVALGVGLEPAAGGAASKP